MESINRNAAIAIVAPEHNPEEIICQQKLQRQIMNEIDKLYSLGYRYFFTGLEEGFVLLATEAIRMYKDRAKVNDIKVICIITSQEQFNEYIPYYRELAHDCMKWADENIYLNQTEFKGGILVKYDTMVNQTNMVLTKYCHLSCDDDFKFLITDIEKRGITVRNIKTV